MTKMGLTELWNKLQVDAKHAWKYHKGSTFAYGYAILLVTTLYYLAAVGFKNGFTLDGPILTFIVLICLSWVLWSVWGGTLASSIYDKEEEKQNKVKLKSDNKMEE